MEWTVLPPSIRVPHHTNDSAATCNVLDARKDLLDILPEDDILPIKLVAGDVLDVRLSQQAEGLSRDHVSEVERRKRCRLGT